MTVTKYIVLSYLIVEFNSISKQCDLVRILYTYQVVDIVLCK